MSETVKGKFSRKTAAFIFMGLLAVSVPFLSADTFSRAKAGLYNRESEKVGVVFFEESEKGVVIKIHINKLKPGEHAFHIHEKSECDPPSFKTSGGHFNPYGKKHGFLNPEGPHAGDLPNILVAKDGTCRETFVTKLVTLEKGAKNSLFRPGGTAVVIHENPDDYITNPAGMGGARIACGAIEECE